MDKIILAGLMFHAHHGVLDAERELGQMFEVDVELHANLRGAGDDISKTVDYSIVYAQIDQVMTGNRFQLLEALAEALAGEILKNALVEKVKLRVKKLSPPVGGSAAYAAVEIERE